LSLINAVYYSYPLQLYFKELEPDDNWFFKSSRRSLAWHSKQISPDAEIEYISKLEMALRRLANQRRKIDESLIQLNRVSQRLYSEKRITINQYQELTRFVRESKRLSAVLDKLLRIYVIDRPMQLWCHVAQMRVEEATDIKPFKQDDDEAIMRAGVSLSQIASLLPYTVEAETARLLVCTTSMIKKQLSKAQYKQTGLESKLLPDWFRRTSLEVVKDDIE
jgi:hypothetical protein